jgi:hypothetical protein
MVKHWSFVVCLKQMHIYSGYKMKRIHIKTILIVFMCCLFLPNLSQAQPSMEFAGYKHDFGVVEEGQILEHVFNFENKGTEELIIKELRSS